MSPTDIKLNHAGNPGLSAPWLHPFAITPADTVTFTNAGRGLWVGTGGNVRVVSVCDDTVTFANVPDGTLLPPVIKQVLSTGTTASDLVSGY